MDNNDTLVSIIIPTLNEEKSLKFCLDAIIKQNYPNYEIIIVDSYSVDDTRKIARNYGAIVKCYPGKPLGARYFGIQTAKGNIILNLDADQVIQENTIKTAVEQIKNYDMLVLEELSYKPQTWVQKQISKERKALFSNLNKNAITEGMGPRVFKKELILQAYSNIKQELLPMAFAHEDKILFFEASKISNNVSIVPNAIQHIEEENLKDLIIHNYKSGKNAKELLNTGCYQQILNPPIKYSSLKKELDLSTFFIIGIRSLSFRLGVLMGN